MLNARLMQLPIIRHKNDSCCKQAIALTSWGAVRILVVSRAIRKLSQVCNLRED